MALLFKRFIWLILGILFTLFFIPTLIFGIPTVACMMSIEKVIDSINKHDNPPRHL